MRFSFVLTIISVLLFPFTGNGFISTIQPTYSLSTHLILATYDTQSTNGAGFSKNNKFNCTLCSQTLDLGNSVEHQLNVYCIDYYKSVTKRADHEQRLQVTGTKDDPDMWTRCRRNVVVGTRLSFQGRYYHNQCFSCIHCHCLLSSSLVYEVSERLPVKLF